jgi:3'-phosphoadenosine 5'-phosphosulfate sulfotransferase (PAPS reductase)/FAD synthetase
VTRKKRKLALVDELSALRSSEEAHAPDLASYDFVVVSTSGGKDSLAQQQYVHWLMCQHGIEDRLIAVHADLGDVEWRGTRELAAKQAAHFGHRFEVVSRIGGTSKGAKRGIKALYEAGEQYGDLLEQVRRRWRQLQAKATYIQAMPEALSDQDIVDRAKGEGIKLGAKYVHSVRETGHPGVPWPDSVNRWCTADFKRGPIEGFFTKLAEEWRKLTGETRPCRILDCWGLRAQESPAKRGRRPRFENRKSNIRQHVDTWLPIKWWDEEQVWHTIRAAGLPYHEAYDLGMPRLSCCFCVLSNRDALMIAGEHNPELLAAYVQLELETGTTFAMDVSLTEIQAAILAGERVERAEAWSA